MRNKLWRLLVVVGVLGMVVLSAGAPRAFGG